MSQVPVPAAFPRIGGGRILVVDDVETYARGEDGLRVTVDQKYDLLLLDCQMPGLDGYEVTRRIRAREAITGGHLPIVAMTAGIMAADENRALDCGMVGYIANPIDVGDLQAVLRKHLKGTTTEMRADSEQSEPAGSVPDPEQFRSLFHEAGQPAIERLADAAATGDLQTIAQEAHRVRGACGTLANEAIVDLSLRLESLCAQGDRAAALQTVERLTEEVVSVSQAKAS